MVAISVPLTQGTGGSIAIELLPAVVRAAFRDLEIEGRTLTFITTEGNRRAFTLPAGGDTGGGSDDGTISRLEFDDTTLTIHMTVGGPFSIDLAPLIAGKQDTLPRLAAGQVWSGDPPTPTTPPDPVTPESVEQRVTNTDATPTAADERKINVLHGQASVTEERVVHEATPQQATFADYSSASYQGVHDVDPAAFGHSAGDWYFNSTHLKPRQVVLSGGEPIYWRDVSFRDVLASPAEYQGDYASDAAATPHVRRVTDVYYDSAARKLREVATFTAGTGAVRELERIRLADVDDVAAARSAGTDAAAAVRSDLTGRADANRDAAAAASAAAERVRHDYGVDGGLARDNTAREAARLNQDDIDALTTTVGNQRTVPSGGTPTQVLTRTTGSGEPFDWQDAPEGSGGTTRPGRKLTIQPTGGGNTITLPADYASYDFVVIEWVETNGRVAIILLVDELPSTGNRTYRSAGSSRVAYASATRQFTLTPAARDFDHATLLEVGLGAQAGAITDAIRMWAGTAGATSSSLDTALKALISTQEISTNEILRLGTLAAGDVGKFLQISARAADGKITIAAVPAPAGGAAGPFRAVVNSLDPAAIGQAVSGERNGDLVLGYSADTVGMFRYSSTRSAWGSVVTWARAGGSGRSDADLEAFIKTIVERWAVQGDAAGVPGSKTFDGLFRSEAQTAIPAGNERIAFNIGNSRDADVVDDTEAGSGSFLITAEQAAEADAFIRVEWSIGGNQESERPTDVELLLQVRDTGAVIGKHNLPLSGTLDGTAQFPVGDAGAKRWAIRVVTKGSYDGELILTHTTYHSGEPLADDPIRHVVHPLISREAEERQQEDSRLTTEIERVEGLAAIVDAMPEATMRVKKAVTFRSDRPYEQTADDAFQVPASGYAAFVLGNFGSVGPLPAALFRNIRHIVYADANHEIGLECDAQGRAALYARTGEALFVSHEGTYNTTNGFVQLLWPEARSGDQPTRTVIADITRRLSALESSGVLVSAVVDGLPTPTSRMVKKAIRWSDTRPYEQRPDDAFLVPETGYVQFFVGNRGATGIMPVEYCVNRVHPVFVSPPHEIGITFDENRRALLYARQGNGLSTLAAGAFATTHGLIMVHYSVASRQPQG